MSVMMVREKSRLLSVPVPPPACQAAMMVIDRLWTARR
jgi:hypothetical protein